MAAPPLSILLDLDGTVVDSKPGILASCSAALRSLGHRPDSLDIANLIAPPLEEFLAELLGRFGDDRVAEAVLAYRGHYGSVGFRETTVYPGLAAALDPLRKGRRHGQGYRLPTGASRIGRSRSRLIELGGSACQSVATRIAKG